jgi:hypothetical protein
MAQEVEHLPSLSRSLGSIPRITNKKQSKPKNIVRFFLKVYSYHY